MKAFIAEQPGRHRFIDVEKPEPGPYDVISSVSYCGICGTDMAILSGETSLVRDGLIRYPVRIGHEWSGVVERVGEKVTGFAPGDRVVGDDGVACGQCRDCMEGHYGVCRYSMAVGTVNCWDGAFAETMRMPMRQMYRLPDDIALDEAALIEPAAIAYNGLLALGMLAGKTLLITGTGPIGLSAVGIARAMGARVVLSGRRTGKLGIGAVMGAHVTVNASEEDPREALAALGAPIDRALETSGNPEALGQCLAGVKNGGSVSTVAFYERNLDDVNIDALVIRNVALHGVSGSANAFPPVIALMESGHLSLRPLITGVYPFDRMEEAIETVRANRDGRIKVLVHMGGAGA